MVLDFVFASESAPKSAGQMLVYKPVFAQHEPRGQGRLRSNKNLLQHLINKKTRLDKLAPGLDDQNANIPNKNTVSFFLKFLCLMFYNLESTFCPAPKIC
jgi:hypothetical protein